jgi:hypothetical protein
LLYHFYNGISFVVGVTRYFTKALFRGSYVQDDLETTDIP